MQRERVSGRGHCEGTNLRQNPRRGAGMKWDLLPPICQALRSLRPPEARAWEPAEAVCGGSAWWDGSLEGPLQHPGISRAKGCVAELKKQPLKKAVSVPTHTHQAQPKHMRRICSKPAPVESFNAPLSESDQSRRK